MKITRKISYHQRYNGYFTEYTVEQSGAESSDPDNAIVIRHVAAIELGVASSSTVAAWHEQRIESVTPNIDHTWNVIVKEPYTD